jgi:hypothetical protein
MAIFAFRYAVGRARQIFPAILGFHKFCFLLFRGMATPFFIWFIQTADLSGLWPRVSLYVVQCGVPALFRHLIRKTVAFAAVSACIVASLIYGW